MCPNIPVVICGNKVDHVDRKVQPKAITFPRRKGLPYYDVSVKANYNIEKPLLWILRELLDDPNLEFTEQIALLPPEVFVNGQQIEEMEEQWKQALITPLCDDDFDSDEEKPKGELPISNTHNKADILEQFGTKRLMEAISPVFRGRRGRQSELPLQDPTWFAVDSLCAFPFHMNETFQFIHVLEHNFHVIRAEALSIMENQEKIVSIPSRKSGKWEAFNFLKQGKTIQKNCVQCPQTSQILEGIPSLIRGCSLGYAYFSILHPDTLIHHCSPCNLKLRCVLPLLVPTGHSCGLTVAGQERQLIEGKVVVYDDSFVHSSWCKGSTQRVDLLLDIWHPQLQPGEITTLSRIL